MQRVYNTYLHVAINYAHDDRNEKIEYLECIIRSLPKVYRNLYFNDFVTKFYNAICLCSEASVQSFRRLMRLLDAQLHILIGW